MTRRASSGSDAYGARVCHEEWCRIPALAEVLERLPQNAALLLELKGGQQATALVDAVAALLSKHQHRSDVLIGSLHQVTGYPVTSSVLHMSADSQRAS